MTFILCRNRDCEETGSTRPSNKRFRKDVSGLLIQGIEFLYGCTSVYLSVIKYFLVWGDTYVFQGSFLQLKDFFSLSFQELGIDSSLFAGVDLLIAVGSIIMVLGFLGCCGAIKESRCMLLLVGKKKNICLPLTDYRYN